MSDAGRGAWGAGKERQTARQTMRNTQSERERQANGKKEDGIARHRRRQTEKEREGERDRSAISLMAPGCRHLCLAVGTRHGLPAPAATACIFRFMTV